MRRGIFVSNIGTYADPGTVADLAVLAEGAGWEALLAKLDKVLAAED